VRPSILWTNSPSEKKEFRREKYSGAVGRSFLGKSLVKKDDLVKRCSERLRGRMVIENREGRTDTLATISNGEV